MIEEEIENIQAELAFLAGTVSDTEGALDVLAAKVQRIEDTLTRLFLEPHTTDVYRAARGFWREGAAD